MIRAACFAGPPRSLPATWNSTKGGSYKAYRGHGIPGARCVPGSWLQRPATSRTPRRNLKKLVPEGIEGRRTLQGQSRGHSAPSCRGGSCARGDGLHRQAAASREMRTRPPIRGASPSGRPAFREEPRFTDVGPSPKKRPKLPGSVDAGIFTRDRVSHTRFSGLSTHRFDSRRRVREHPGLYSENLRPCDARRGRQIKRFAPKGDHSFRRALNRWYDRSKVPEAPRGRYFSLGVSRCSVFCLWACRPWRRSLAVKFESSSQSRVRRRAGPADGPDSRLLDGSRRQSRRSRAAGVLDCVDESRPTMGPYAVSPGIQGHRIERQRAAWPRWADESRSISNGLQFHPEVDATAWQGHRNFAGAFRPAEIAGCSGELGNRAISSRTSVGENSRAGRFRTKVPARTVGRPWGLVGAGRVATPRQSAHSSPGVFVDPRGLFCGLGEGRSGDGRPFRGAAMGRAG